MSHGYPGLFITFEGLDYSGKSTHVEQVYAALATGLIPTLKTREPGGTPMAEAIRHVFQEVDWEEDVHPETELLLLHAQRIQHTRNVIIPALEAGKIVFSDRYEDSTRAYQIGGREQQHLDPLRQRNFDEMINLVPDRTYLFTSPPELVATRGLDRDKKDRMDSQGLEFYKRCYDQYQRLVSDEPERFVEIDPIPKFEKVFPIVMKDVENFLLSNQFL